MAELRFSGVSLLVVVLYFQLEMFYSLCYNNVIFLAKILKIKKTTGTNSSLVLSNANYFSQIFFVVSVLTLKGSSPIAPILLLFVSFFSLKLNYILRCFNSQTVNNNVIQFVLPLFAGFVFALQFVTSYLTLFFYIEVYGVLYYFCFLTSYSFSNQTILKYKNGLLMLLWNNFLTTFFLAFGCFLITWESGTTSFSELALLHTTEGYVYIFLIGLSWKLGLPIFHFFKLEVYKYLLKENVFLFSVLTTVVNLVILFFCLGQPVVYSAIYSCNYIVLMIVFASIVTIVNLKLGNILQFFAISSMLTMMTLLTVYLI